MKTFRNAMEELEVLLNKGRQFDVFLCSHFRIYESPFRGEFKPLARSPFGGGGISWALSYPKPQLSVVGHVTLKTHLDPERC